MWNHIYKACFVLPVIFINNKNQKIIDFSLELEEIVPLANWSVKSNLDKRWKRCVLYTIASLDYQESNSSLVSIPADALKKKEEIRRIAALRSDRSIRKFSFFEATEAPVCDRLRQGFIFEIELRLGWLFSRRCTGDGVCLIDCQGGV